MTLSRRTVPRLPRRRPWRCPSPARPPPSPVRPAASTTAGRQPRPAAAPVVTAPSAGTPVPGQYVVVFRPGTRGAKDLARTLVREQGGQLLHTYEHALQGFAARLPEGKAAALRRNPNVAARRAGHRRHGRRHADRRHLGAGPLRPARPAARRLATPTATRAPASTSTSSTPACSPRHTEFTGRMGNGFDAVTAGGSATDCNGHGTHVAGTAAGATYGIADKAVVHPVRVLGCTGSRHQLRASSPASTGCGQPRQAGRRQHEPRRRRLLRPRHRREQRDRRRRDLRGRRRQRQRRRLRRLAVPRRRRPSPSARRRAPTPARRSRTTAAASTCSRPARASPRPGTPAAPPRTRSAGRPWRRRTSPAPQRCYLSANPGASPAAVRTALVSGGTTGRVTGAGHRLAERPAAHDPAVRRDHDAAPAARPERPGRTAASRAARPAGRRATRPSSARTVGCGPAAGRPGSAATTARTSRSRRP